MKKKFRVRVKHFAKGRYMVQYASYYLFPTWYSLEFWLGTSHGSGPECWSTNFWGHKEAEEFAKTLKSIEDVKEYYKPEEEKERKWREEEEKFWKENNPYESKTINN